MISALPFFPGLLESPIQGNGRMGGVGLEQPTTTGNPSDNPFAKILRDQSATFSLLKNRQLTVPSADQKRLPDLESLPDNQYLSLQVLPGQDIPVDVFRESSSAIVALPLTDNVQLNPYQVMFLGSNGQKLNEPEAFIPTLSISLPSLAGNGRNGYSEVEIPTDQIAPLPGDFSHEGQLVHALVSPQVLLAGEPGAEGVQAKTPINQPGLLFLTGYSFPQAAPVESSLADKSATHIVTNSDRQQLLQDAVKGISQLAGFSDGKPATESAVAPGKNVGKPLDPVSGTLQDADTLLLRIPPAPAGASQGPLKPLVNQAFPAPLPFEETSASLADAVQLSQSRMKYVNGVSPVLSESSGNGKEPSLAFPSDLLGESSLSSTGDRSKDILEATGKGMGVDPSGGQGVNNGMGGSPHSQSGFQQSSSSLSPGSRMRMVEERGPDLPTPALQRLQMDVQLSETNRIQIDVGVQQRQVYAGLLMDQGTMRNLAVQFVPQLEEQLAQSDMDLKEFSAEVRDHHREQETATSSDWTASQQGHRASTIFSHAQESNNTSVTRVEERGWHYVA